MLRFTCALWVFMVACSACRDGGLDPDRSNTALRRTAPCDKWAGLAADVGCGVPDECDIDPSCDRQARTFIDCVADDITQCLCEADDGELNCEGAFKPNEGPARCFAEHRELDRCLSRDDSDP